MSEEPNILDLVDEDEQEFLSTFREERDPYTVREEADETDVSIRVDWLLERIARRRARIAQNDAVARARHDQIEDWHVSENAKLERAIEWLEYQIRELVPPDGAGFQERYGQKSLALPFGKVGFRQNPARVEVFDEDRALEWARLHKLEIKVRESYSKTDLKKAIQHTDDPPDGFQLIPGSEEFYVKADVSGERTH